jgi:hypothetical protein
MAAFTISVPISFSFIGMSRRDAEALRLRGKGFKEAWICEWNSTELKFIPPEGIYCIVIR